MSTAAIAAAPQTTSTDFLPRSLETAHGSIKSERMPTAAPSTLATPPHAPVTLAGDLRRIVLTGFMGAGKTTVGRRLALELGWEFVDLDTLIEQRTGLTVPAIFAEQGEAAFRRIESIALAVALGRKGIVLALGGGTPELLTNRLLLEQTPGTLTVYLHAPLEILTARCLLQEGGAERPVLTNPDEAARRFANRLPHYKRLAGVIMDTTSSNAEETAVLLSDRVKASK